MSLILEHESYLIRHCIMNVYNEIGCGFLEKVYQEALEIEFQLNKLPYRRESPINVYYKGVQLQQSYIADFICYDKIIIELKAVSSISDTHRAQIYNYLKATNYRLGILVNFGGPELEIIRIVNKFYTPTAMD